MKLDPYRYPLAAAYMASLPQGLDSFPNCQASGAFPAELRKDHPSITEDSHLPPSLTDLLKAPWTNDTWIPETLAVLQVLLCRDRVLTNDKLYLDYARQRAMRIVDRPLFRTLMHVLSPSLMILGAGRRWDRFHRGTELQTVPSHEKNLAILNLQSPPGLFPPFLLHAYSMSYTVALECTGAQGVVMDVRLVGPGVCQYHIRWT